jgi:hypothetical protein
MASTLYLDRQVWDLVLDGNGNIAMATEPYSRAQDVASECRTWQGEVFYDVTRGLPYASQILGKSTPIEYTKAQLVAAALLVPGVVSARAYLKSSPDRKLGGQIQITDSSGTVTAATF